MSTKAWIIFVGICVVLFGGLIMASQKERVDVSSVKPDTILNASEANGNIGDHVYGNKSAKVILIEYGDYQCPGCGAAHPRVKELTEKYKDNVAFVFRNFPLSQSHPNARAAAAAVEAVGLKGDFWAMHNTMFENQDEWSDASGSDRTVIFENLTELAGISKDEFRTVLDEQNDRLNKKINFDQTLGRKVEVSGTPTFFLNGTKLTEEQTASDESFEKVLVDELKRQGVSIK